MKIALVILRADPTRGGAERYTVDLAAALVEAGHDVAIVSTAFAGGTPGRAVELKVTARSRRKYYLETLNALEAHLAETTYDVVHAMLPVRRCDVYHPHAGLAAEALANGHRRFNGVRRSLAALGNRLNRKRRAFARVERQLLTGAAAPVVICLSEYVKRSVRQFYPRPDLRLAALFNAVDLKKFDPARPAEDIRARFQLGDRTVALIVAQDFQRKGLAEAILALPGTDPSLVLLVVGKEPPGAYARLAAKEGVADRVIFAGATDDIFSFYKAADFFVLPTRHDPCSLVVLEALAMGVPVISTAANGACEIMTDGIQGFILEEANDVVALHERYVEMLAPDRRAAMAAACLQLRLRLSQDNHVRELLAIYDGVGGNSTEVT